ncbi:MAG: YfiR family protein [Gammaproteobacteria bacterium]
MRRDLAVGVTGRTLKIRLLALLVASAACHGLLADEAQPQRIDQLKAAYLVNFVKFVEWPAALTPDVLTICFLGGASVRAALPVDLNEKRVNGRRLEVRELQAGESLAGCQVLYFEPAAGANQPAPRAADGLLTISDATDFVQHAGIIGLFTEANRLRFDINLANAQRAGLRISSALLQLASSVQKEAS